MDTYVLNAEPRSITGKKVKKLRAEGRVPAVVYGTSKQPLLITVARGELEKVYHRAGASSVVEVKLPDTTENVLIHEIAHHPVTGLFLHADFYQVRMDEKTKAMVPLVFENTETAPAIRELDGVLITNLNEVEVEALPRDLPHELVVDGSKLATFEDVVLVSDIPVPAGATIITDPETNILTVQPPKSQEQLDAELAEDTTVTTADDVEVEGEEGEGEEGAEGEAGEGEAAEGGEAKGGDEAQGKGEGKGGGEKGEAGKK